MISEGPFQTQLVYDYSGKIAAGRQLDHHEHINVLASFFTENYYATWNQ